MKVRTALFNITCRALYESFAPDMIVRLAKIVMPGYDLHARTGIPDNIPVTAQAAAQQGLRDVAEAGLYLPFVESLSLVNEQGYMGRECRVHLLPQIHKQIAAEGYAFDPGTGLFMEDARETATPTWGRLVEGEDRQVAFLRMDVVKNSELVRKNPQAAVSEAFKAFRRTVERAVISRSGRVWTWEGDGCLCAFVFGSKETAALLSGMEILHELYFYNRLANPMKDPLVVRMAAHSGSCRYWATPAALMKEETVRETLSVESSFAKPGFLAATTSAYLPVDRLIQDRFGPERTCGSFKLRSYSIALEGA